MQIRFQAVITNAPRKTSRTRHDHSRYSRLPALYQTLGLQKDLSGFYHLAASDRRLADLARPFEGVRPTRLPTLFEAVISGIACQQVTLALGIELLNRLAEPYGTVVTVENTASRALPLPETLARLETLKLKSFGFSSTADAAADLISQWHSHAGLVYFLLLLRKLAGLKSPSSRPMNWYRSLLWHSLVGATIALPRFHGPTPLGGGHTAPEAR